MRAALSLLIFLGCSDSPPDLPPLPSRQITGTVVERDPRSGQLLPSAGVRVKLVEGSYATTSLDDGFFILGGLPLGVHSIDLGRGERYGRPVAARRLTSLRVVAELSLDLGAIELGGVGDLEGSVRLADRSEAVVAAGSIALVSGTAYQAVVDARGEYVLPGVPEGRFEVAVVRAGYRPATLGPVPVLPNLVSRVRAITLEPDPSRAMVAVDGGVEVSDSDPSGVEVEATDEASGEIYEPAVTDASGAYRVDLLPGAYRLRFRKDGFLSAELRGVIVLDQATILGLTKIFLARGDSAPTGDPDGDGCPNDAFPEDSLACRDADADEIPDELDADDDGDGLSDAEELSPGLDGAITDPLAEDSDGDGAADASDVCPSAPDPDQRDADGDGLGDLCDPTPDGPPTGDPPIISSFAPESAPVGAMIVITGAQFHPTPSQNAIRFGEASPSVALAEPASTESQLLVRVPQGAIDGRLVVTNGFGSATSTESFTLLDGPEIRDLSPRRVTAGQRVTLSGRFLEGGIVRVGGVVVAASDGVPAGEALDFFAPDLPGTHAMSVERLGVVVIAPYNLVIVGRPALTDVVPNPAGIGETILISGIDLDGNGPGDTEVEFAGGIVVEPTFASALFLRAVVPDGAMTGPMIVRHRSSGDSDQVELTVDPLRPIITGQSRVVAIEGINTITLYGLNLHAPPARELIGVTIGGVPTSTVSLNDFVVEVAVPVGAPAGDVVASVMSAAGLSTAAAPDPITILRPGTWAEPPAPASIWSGFGFGELDRVYAVTRFGNESGVGLVLDAQLAPIPGTEIDLGPLFNGELVFGLSVAPAGSPRLGLLFTAVRTYIVTLPGFQPLGSCSVVPLGLPNLWDGGPATHVSGAEFSPDGRLAYLNSSAGELTVIDLSNVACTSYPAGLTTSPILFPGQDLLFVNAGLSAGVFDPAAGAFVEPLSGSSFGSLFYAVDAFGRVWGAGGPNNGGFFRYDMAARSVAATFPASTHFGAISSDRRFFFGVSGELAVVDTALDRSQPLMPVRYLGAVLPHPVDSRFLLLDIGDRFQGELWRLQMFEIEAPP
jgi:hypothetical protein